MRIVQSIRARPTFLAPSPDLHVSCNSYVYVAPLTPQSRSPKQLVSSLRHRLTETTHPSQLYTSAPSSPVRSTPPIYAAHRAHISTTQSRTTSVPSTSASTSTSTNSADPTDSDFLSLPFIQPSRPPLVSVSRPAPSPDSQSSTKRTLERCLYAKSFTKISSKIGSVTACGNARPRVWTPWSVILGYKNRPPAVYADKVHYFAFGSNMGVQKLQSRGGGIPLLAAEPGYVLDHRLAFNLLCLPPVEPCMGSMEREGGSRTHGLLVAMERGEYELLYMTEGGGSGEGRAYLEQLVTVNTYDGKKVEIAATPRLYDLYHAWGAMNVNAVTFQTNPRSRQFLPRWLELPPSRRYLNLLIHGAVSSGVDPDYIVELRKIRAVFEGGR